jgi:hypothetical protein
MQTSGQKIAEVDYLQAIPNSEGGTDELLIFVSTGFVLLM